jgi:hypothetical protein
MYHFYRLSIGTLWTELCVLWGSGVVTSPSLKPWRDTFARWGTQSRSESNGICLSKRTVYSPRLHPQKVNFLLLDYAAHPELWARVAPQTRELDLLRRYPVSSRVLTSFWGRGLRSAVIGATRNAKPWTSPRFLDSRLRDGADGASLKRRPLSTPQEDYWDSFLLEAEASPGPRDPSSTVEPSSSLETMTSWSKDTATWSKLQRVRYGIQTISVGLLKFLREGTAPRHGGELRMLLKTQGRSVDTRRPSILGAGRGSNNSSPWRLSFLSYVEGGLGLGRIIWTNGWSEMAP